MVFGMYIILMPFVPFGAWWIVHEAPIISKPAYIAAPSSANEFPAKPTLVVPALAMKETVHEGNGEATLNLGTWHIPDTSSPDKGGNTVLAAHRHTRSGPGVFYHLDKLKPGDDIYMYWQQKRYHYAVQNISVVPSTQVSVEAPTSDARLTLYTCTPLWSFKDRLVVQATLKEFL
jgi:sortase A